MTGRAGMVVVGGSLAGSSCADELRQSGYTGPLTVVGAELHLPYDRPPLAKAVLSGHSRAGHLSLATHRPPDVNWILGVPVAELDRPRRRLVLADGHEVVFDQLVVTTGVRARPWHEPTQALLRGVHKVRTLEDGAGLAAALDAAPRRAVVIGGGFIAGEVASACRGRGLAVTVVARASHLLESALGGVVGGVIDELARDASVDLRLDSGVRRIIGADGVAVGVELSDGEQIDADVVVIATGTVPNVEWLAGCDLQVSARGVVCDTRLRALRRDGSADPLVRVAGDVALWPHPQHPGRLIDAQHWGAARAQGRYAARSLLNDDGPAFDDLPAFWSNQWGVNIKCVGDPTLADQVQVVLGSTAERRFIALYGAEQHVVAAVAFDMPRELGFTTPLIQRRTAFPYPAPVADRRADLEAVQPAGLRARTPADKGADRPLEPTDAGPRTRSAR